MSAPLTAKAIDNAKPDPDKRRELPDGGCPGLYLVIQPGGARSWAFRYRHLGQPRKMTLGNFPTVPLADKRDGANGRGKLVVKGARTLVAEAREVLDAGRDPGAERMALKAEAGSDLYPAVVQLFIERHATAKNKHPQQTARRLGLTPDEDNPGQYLVAEGGLAERWEKRRVQDLTRRDVQAAADDITTQRGGVAANRTLGDLRSFFNWCVDKRHLMSASPCVGVDDPAEKVARDRVLSDDEIRWLWQAAGECKAPTFGRLAKALLLTGQRRSEAAGTTSEEILEADRLWRIPGERTKNGQPHEVPLSQSALAVFADRAPFAKAKFVFTTDGKTSLSGFSKGKTALDAAMLDAAKRERGDDATVAPWRLHDLRRTAATIMGELGIADGVIEKILNHLSGPVFGGALKRAYRHEQLPHLKRQALNAWARYVALVLDRDTLAVVKEHLRNTGDDDEAARRNELFNEKIRAGGEAWSNYIAALTKPNGGNVVALAG